MGAAKPPPRPTPGSVTYTDDESDKAYDNNPDESSLTEKPSEISSTDSQVKTIEIKVKSGTKKRNNSVGSIPRKVNRVAPAPETPDKN
jgi:hypothetical protein